MKAYFISGLAAGKKAFQYISLPEEYEPVYLDWITPEKNESLKDYAQRFAEGIEHGPFVIIGLSFGGMLATEIADFKKPEKIILISSIASSAELPWYYRAAGKINLHRVIPVNWLKKASLLKRLVSAETPEVKAVLSEYVKQADPDLIRWSLDAIVHWDHRDKFPGIIQVHGDRDLLLPLRYTHPQYILKNAGHMMVMNQAQQLNDIIRKVLQSQAVTAAASE